MRSPAPTPALQEIGRKSARLLGQFSPIILSNRAPIEPTLEGSFVPGAGGLVKALTSLATAVRASWVAAARTDAEREIASQGTHISSDAGSEESFPIFFAPTEFFHIPSSLLKRPFRSAPTPATSRTIGAR